MLLTLAAAAPSSFALVATPAPPTPAAPAALARSIEHNFKTSGTLSTEAIYVVKLLEAAHYNRAAVTPADYSDIVPAYMLALDPTHLFFLNSDKVDFSHRFDGQTVYYKVAVTGDIDPAYEIFYVCQNRVQARVKWLLNELNKDFDLTGNDTFAVDRSKTEWPATEADADDLWHRRLKFDLIGELLNKKTLVQAKEVVRKRYEGMLKNFDDIEASDLAEIYLTCITGLYDPHSSYFSADTYEDFGITMKLQLVGIGAMLRLKDEYCTVEELVPGGPADLGHLLKPNDKIISVAQDGAEPVDIIGMKLRKVVNMIRGQKGTKVRLTVQPAGATDTSARKSIVITRDVVKLNSARAHAAIFQVPATTAAALGAAVTAASGTMLVGATAATPPAAAVPPATVPIGVITLPEFYGPADDSASDRTSASRDTAALIQKLKAAGIQALVLDLRNNGGGFLGEAINLAGLFIPAGPVVQVRDSDGRRTVDSSDASQVTYDGPLAVLTNRFSASASEIVAGALQNYGRAVVVGDKSTHGKGTVQTVVEMKNISRELHDADAKTGAAKITIQKFYLPSGSSTQLRGVVPDISLPSIDDYLPIGESSLPHALIWDSISSTAFNGKPIDPQLLSVLLRASEDRQNKLDEFAYLRRSVDWFRARQDQKLVSLNLMERRRQKESDDAFLKEAKSEKLAMAQADYPHKEFWLGPPPPPKVKPTKDDSSPDDDDESTSLSTDDTSPYPSMDVPLRETFRILDDAIDLGRKHQYWAADHPPLTIARQD